MFMYSFELRTLSGPGGKPQFPAAVEFRLRFKPTLPFGVGSGRSKTVFPTKNENEYDLSHDPFIGKVWAKTEGPGPIKVDVPWNGITLSFIGPEVRTTMRIEDDKAFENVLYRFFCYLPLFLGIRFREPIWVEKAWCVIDGKKFGFLARRTPGILVNETNLDDQAKSASSAVEDLKALCAFKNFEEARPVLVSIKYFLAAQRLLDVGETPREFFGEAILNYTKSLEALWGGSRDDIRKGLARLGVSQDQIKNVFIPVCLLRNICDAGHTRLSLPSQSLLDRLYEHIEHFDSYYIMMFERVLEAIRKGNTPCLVRAVNPCIDSELEPIMASLDQGASLQNEGKTLVRYRAQHKKS